MTSVSRWRQDAFWMSFGLIWMSFAVHVRALWVSFEDAFGRQLDEFPASRKLQNARLDRSKLRSAPYKNTGVLGLHGVLSRSAVAPEKNTE